MELLNMQLIAKECCLHKYLPCSRRVIIIHGYNFLNFKILSINLYCLCAISVDSSLINMEWPVIEMAIYSTMK